MRYFIIILALLGAWGFYLHAQAECSACSTDAECELWCGKEY